MSKIILTLLLLSFFVSACDKKPEKRGFKANFSEFFMNDTGSFVLYDFNNRYYLYHNEEKTKEKYTPGQTYIYLAGINFYNKFNNLNLTPSDVSDTSKIKMLIDSAGLDIQKKSITDFKYGNLDTAFSTDNFFKNGELKISVQEQVEFIKELYSTNEKFKSIKNNFVTDTINTRNVSYIVSSTGDNSWCTGTVEFGSNLYVFALNLNSGNKLRALEITQNILYSFKILEE